MPVEDRAADTWEPLVIVADHAGGTWPDRARAAVLALTAEAAEDDEGTPGVHLLRDCRAIFADSPAVPTSQLLLRLNADPEAPWRASGNAGLTGHRLGAMLREYRITSRNIRFPDGSQAKGYHRDDFADAWRRYCPALTPDEQDSAPGNTDNVTPFRNVHTGGAA